MTVALSRDQPAVGKLVHRIDALVHCRAGSRVHAAPVSASAQAWTADGGGACLPTTTIRDSPTSFMSGRRRMTVCPSRSVGRVPRPWRAYGRRDRRHGHCRSEDQRAAPDAHQTPVNGSAACRSATLWHLRNTRRRIGSTGFTALVWVVKPGASMRRIARNKPNDVACRLRRVGSIAKVARGKVTRFGHSDCMRTAASVF